MKHEHDVKITINIPQLSDVAKLFSNQFSIINQKLDNMALTQQQLAQQLTDLKAQVEKVKAEVQAKLDALATAIENDKNVSGEVETAFGELKTAVQGVDDLNVDAPTE